MTTVLSGLTWDHPQTRDPLAAISAEWTRGRDLSVTWDARPRSDIEDRPFAELTAAYDLILIDYLSIAAAAGSGLIVPVDDWADAAYLRDQSAHSVGPSYSSYSWGGKQWALAIEAACQVSAVRDDLWNWSTVERGPLPQTWTEVVALAEGLRLAPSKVALPLNEEHAYCAFLSVGISIAGHGFWRPGQEVDGAAGRDALELLRRLAAHVHPISRDGDPIAVSEHMAHSDEVLYVPLMFGYSHYARRGRRPNQLRFWDAPAGPSGVRGAVLSGAGLALSTPSANRQAAAELARHIASPDIQSGLYAAAGGQPAHAAAWQSVEVNAQTGWFFVATRQTIDGAFMQPRIKTRRRFQSRAGALIEEFIWTRATSADACLEEFQRLVDECSLVGAPAD
jgi:multiple sugar transport system substrate-binding protein